MKSFAILAIAVFFVNLQKIEYQTFSKSGPKYGKKVAN